MDGKWFRVERFYRLPPLLGSFFIGRSPAGAAPIVKRFPAPDEVLLPAPNVGVGVVGGAPKPELPAPNPEDGNAVFGVAGEAAGDPNENGLLLLVEEAPNPKADEG